MNEKTYSLGLDLGTNSVGWAVVDQNNQLVKKGDFTLWGVRMFDEGQSAQERRINRNSRRRLARRRWRIELLQDLFKSEIDKIDPNFFQRINDSFLKKEDKLLNNSHTFFDDDFTDKEYFDKYPTIYHLKKDLIESDKKFDIRMVYLAIHHIIKYRGNFLHDGEISLNSTNNYLIFIDSFNESLRELQEEYEDEIDYFSEIHIEKLEKFNDDLKNIMIPKERTNNKEKESQLLHLFNVPKKSLVAEFVVKLFVYGKINISSLSFLKDEKYDKLEIIINSEDLMEKIEEAKSKIKELVSIYDYAKDIKQISDDFYLIKLLGDNQKYISCALVNQYNNHAKELSELKALISKYCPERYNEVFRMHKDKLANYPSYIGMNSTNGKMERFSHCLKEDFYKYIKSVLGSIKNKENEKTILEIFTKIDEQNYLLRQNSGQNTAIPMQLNRNELNIILENQGKYYSFLNDVSDNLSVKEKILSIFNYHLPYYVGPLNNNSPFSWVVKRSNEKVYPWNVEKVVDYDESGKKFINRMQNKCTYLIGEDDYCLPKKSLLFSEYNCLQFLNKLTINGSPISVDLKNKIFEELFLLKKNVSLNDIKEYIRCETGLEDVELNKNSQVNCDMSSYVRFKEIFGEDFNKNIDLIEEIIKDITIFEDKKILERRLKEVYCLDDSIVKKIKDLNYKGYGKLCRNLLDGIESVDHTTGERYGTIIELLRSTTMNLQQLLFDDRYNFNKVIDEYNSKFIDELKQDSYVNYISDLCLSPIAKRSIIQAYKIIEEVEKIIKHKIDYYYIECTRTNKSKEKNKVSSSRYEKIKEKINSAKKIAKELNEFNIDINKLSKEFDKLNEKVDMFRSDKIYLYYSQLGKCLYTLKDIDLDEINSNYDIDHIYPQSIIKDDSLSNRVLTDKYFNQQIKKDQFLFDINIPNRQKLERFYKLLKDNELITNEKYNRLTKRELSENELDMFVNRQLTTTNYAVKVLIDLLKNYKGVSQSSIIYSKSENISYYRKKFDIQKSRTANNFHHAHDAYLNVVIGRVIDNYFKHNFYKNTYRDFKRLQNEHTTINVEKVVLYDRYYYDENHNKVYYYEKDKVLAILNKNIKHRFDINETTRQYISDELFGKITINPAGKEANVPIKNNLPVDKYGGLKQDKFNKYIITKVINKKKIDYVLEPIPERFSKKIDVYLNIIYKGKDYEILVDNIKSNVEILYESREFCITGKTNESYVIKNLKDRYFSYESIKTIKKIDKYFDMLKGNEFIDHNDNLIILQKKNEWNEEIKITKDECIKLINEIISLFSKEIYAYSQTKNIMNKLQEFNNSLTVDGNCRLISELLTHLKTNERATSNLEVLGLSKKAGTLTISNKLSPGMKLQYSSVTGYYKNTIFEVPNGVQESSN